MDQSALAGIGGTVFHHVLVHEVQLVATFPVLGHRPRRAVQAAHVGGIAVPAQLGNALVTLQQHQLVVVAGGICPLNQRAIGHFRGQLGREGLVRGEG